MGGVYLGEEISASLDYHEIHPTTVHLHTPTPASKKKKKVECFYRDFKGSFKDVYISRQPKHCLEQNERFHFGTSKLMNCSQHLVLKKRHFYWLGAFSLDIQRRKKEGEGGESILTLTLIFYMAPWPMQ